MEVNSTDGEGRGGGESPHAKYKVHICDFCNHCLFMWSPECLLVYNISECIFRCSTGVNSSVVNSMHCCEVLGHLCASQHVQVSTVGCSCSA